MINVIVLHVIETHNTLFVVQKHSNSLNVFPELNNMTRISRIARSIAQLKGKVQVWGPDLKRAMAVDVFPEQTHGPGMVPTHQHLVIVFALGEALLGQHTELCGEPFTARSDVACRIFASNLLSTRRQDKLWMGSGRVQDHID